MQASPQPPIDDVVDVSSSGPAYTPAAAPHVQRHIPSSPPAASEVQADAEPPAINLLDIRTLPIGSKVGICWGFLWRGSVVSLGSMVISLVLGFLIENQTSSVVLIFLGLVMMGTGFYCIYLWVMWLLTTSIGRFKLLLVNSSELGSR